MTPMKMKPKTHGHDWLPSEDALLGTMADSDVAAVTGIGIKSVERRRWKLGISAFHSGHLPIDWMETEIALLGTMTDAAVAERVGCTRAAVWFKRQVLGVPRFCGPGTNRPTYGLLPVCDETTGERLA